jgi:2-oxoglutarate dehydrogenase E1 component
MRVLYPSTPGSYFHALRWQGRDSIEKPMVVFTPKSLLRHPKCISTLQELAEGSFQPLIDDPADPARVTRVVLCSGKLYYDLAKAREDAQAGQVALVRLEQLYPFPGAEIAKVLSRHAPSAQLVWAQEEPKNMGAWRFVRERFLDGDVEGAAGRPLRYVGRAPSASPAPGSHKVHVQEQEQIVREAFAS